MEWELQSFTQLLRDEGVKVYGEVGARHGDTFHYIVSSLKCRGVALDLPEAAWGKQRSREALERAVKDLKKRGLEADCIFGNSRTLATRQLFHNRGPYDAILIDGDHTYAGVKADWENYRGMSRIVAFHDIAGEGQGWRHLSVEVPRLWREIKQEYRTIEFIADNSLMGIGVVWMPE